MDITHKKSRHKFASLLAMLIGIMPLSIDAYLPSLPQIALSLHSDIHHIEKSISTFIFGVALGQLIGGSLSDIKGRRRILLLGLVIYIVATIALIFVQTANQLLILRMLQALGGGMSSVIVGALVRDHYHGKDAAQMFALIGVILAIAPLLAPMLGAVLQSMGGWRSVFVFLAAYATLVFVLFFKLLPQNVQASGRLTWAQVQDMGRRYRMVLTTKPALGFLFYQAASFSSMMAFLTESPFVYMQLYGLTTHQYALVFASNMIMMVACNRLTAFGLRRDWTSAHLLKIGIAIQLMANCVLCVLVLVMKQPPLMTLVPLVMVSVGAQGLIAANTQALFMSHFKPQMAGSANAMLSAGQSLIAATVAFVVTQLHNGTVLVMVGTMLMVTVSGVYLLLRYSSQQFRGEPAA